MLCLAALVVAILSVAVPAAADIGAFAEYAVPTPSSQPVSIVTGPDGALWFTEGVGNTIGRLSVDGSFSEFPIPTANSSPDEIAAGPDGNLWFAEVLGNKIGRISTAGVISDFTVPTPKSSPIAVAAGADGNVWFTEVLGNKVGRITATGQITEFLVPTPGSQPFVPAAGADGAVWFTERIGNNIGRIDPASGAVTEFPLPNPNSRPFEMTSGPDGNIWFTERLGNRIGRITPTGQITEFQVPTVNGHPNTIRPGPDPNPAENCAFQLERLGEAGFNARYGNSGGCVAAMAVTKTLWFTEDSGNRVAQITTSGDIFEFPVPTSNSQPIGIAEGSDGGVWFAESAANKIGRLDMPNIGKPASPGARSSDATADPLAALLVAYRDRD